jgi:hypothetical protein
MPVLEGNRRGSEPVPVYLLFVTPINPMTPQEIGAFASLEEAGAAAATLLHATNLSWEYHGDSDGSMWFTTIEDGTMYSIHSVVKTKLDI